MDGPERSQVTSVRDREGEPPKEYTTWWCERCHASGEFKAPVSVYDAIETLRAVHDAHQLAWQTHCLFDTGFVRVQMSESELTHDA